MERKDNPVTNLELLEPRLLLSGESLFSQLVDTAEIVNVRPAASVVVNGDFISNGQGQLYSFTAPASGRFFIDMEAQSGNLDSMLQLFNWRGRRCRRNDNASRRTRDSRIRMRVRPGQTFYVLAGSKADTGGSYDLTFTSKPRDDYGNTFETARRLRVNRRGRGRGRGTINYRGDVDMMRLVAPITGEMSINMFAGGRRNSLDPEIFIYDADGQLLAHDDDSGTGFNSLVKFDVTAGETYYVKAASWNNYSTGRYGMRISTVKRIDPPPAPDPSPDPNPDEPQPGTVITGQVISMSGSLQLRVLGTNGTDVITLNQSANAITLATGSGTQTFAGSFAGVMVYGFDGDDRIRLTNSVSAAGWVYAGAGNDTIYEAGAGTSTLYGGLGNDLLITVGGGADILRGQDGFDSFWGDSSDSVIDASTSELAAKSVHSISQFYQPYTTNPGSSLYVSMEIAGQNLADPTPTSYAAGWRNFAGSPLFADGPEYNDIKQGAIGDCYYLASLAGLADTDPMVIRQMITALGDGTYAMRFYNGTSEVYLRLDADLPVNSYGSLAYAKTSPDGEIWIALAEKAYCYYRYGQNSYASISGGWMSTVFRQITGGYTNTRFTSGSATDLYNYFATHLSQGHSVTLGSYYDAANPVVGGHAYMVKSVQYVGGQHTVTVYNPWGVDGRSWDSNYYDGLLTLSIQQIQDNYSAAVTSLA